MVGCRGVVGGAGDIPGSRPLAKVIPGSGVKVVSRSVMKVDWRVTGVGLGVFGMWITIWVTDGMF